jgi:hypothetical protein
MTMAASALKAEVWASTMDYNSNWTKFIKK